MRHLISFACRLAGTVVLVLVLGFVPADNGASLTDQQRTESAMANSSGQPPTPSDREKAGLRGPVEECIAERKYGQGSWKMAYATKYDRDGRIYQTVYVNNDGSKGTQSLTYDAEGHLLTKVWEAQGKALATIYNYDAQGRLIGITDQRDWITSFEYDQGRKTRIVQSKLEASSTDDQSRLGASIEIENVDLFVAPPPGGSVKTSFNGRDQPVEAQVYGPNGDLLKRLTRTYDSKGRVEESSLVIDKPDSILSPGAVKRIAAEPGGAEELEKELARFLGDQRVLVRSSYVYDDQGRVTEKRIRFGPSGETITRFIYNDQGDEVEEITTNFREMRPNEAEGGKLSSDTPDSSSPVESRTHFSYQYDSFGNWTEKIASSLSTANEPPRIWTIEHRTIAYY
jgi:YD repeat-containing protein